MNRANERLVSSDNAIIQVRRRLLGLAMDLMEGKEPPTTSKPSLYQVQNHIFQLPPGEDPVEKAAPFLQAERT